MSLCQNPSSGSLHVTVLKAMGLPQPKSEAASSGELGKILILRTC